jgi:hypothetical protein
MLKWILRRQDGVWLEVAQGRLVLIILNLRVILPEN